jgi:sugar fermentation stimulation protein A
MVLSWKTKRYHFRSRFLKFQLTITLSRINRHRSERKNLFWHIDYLREHAGFHAALPIRTSAGLECGIAASMSTMADWQVDDFGSSDCSCETHLFGMKDDPVHSPEFIRRLLYFRMGRLEEKLAEGA